MIADYISWLNLWSGNSSLCVFVLSVISVIVFVVVVVRNAVHRLVVVIIIIIIIIVIRDLKMPVFGVRIRVLVSTGRRYLARRNGWFT